MSHQRENPFRTEGVIYNPREISIVDFVMRVFKDDPSVVNSTTNEVFEADMKRAIGFILRGWSRFTITGCAE